MSYSIVTGPDLIQRLKTAISAQPDTRLAVAFWGAGASEALGLTKGSKARLICNLMSGSTNPSEIETLQDLGIEVRKHATLHAKIGIVGEGLSFVGSSNMSSNGLGFEGREQSGWEETNVVFDHADSDISTRFEALWGDATPITKSDLEKAADLWRPRRTFALRNKALAAQNEISIWKAIVENDDRLRAAPCVVAYYYEMNDDDKAAFNAAEEEIKNEYGAGNSAYMDWNELPEAYIIGSCRSRHRDDTIKDVEVSCRPPNSVIYEKGGAEFLVVKKETRLPGFAPLKGGDLKSYKELLVKYIGSKKRKKSRIIPIVELMDFYAESREA